MTYQRIDCEKDCQTHREREHYVGYKVKQKWSPNSPFCAECTLGQLRTAEGEIESLKNLEGHIYKAMEQQITALKAILKQVVELPSHPNDFCRYDNLNGADCRCHKCQAREALNA